MNPNQPQLFQLEQPQASLPARRSPSIRRGTTRLWSCGWCGALLELPKPDWPCGSCPSCDHSGWRNREHWWTTEPVGYAVLEDGGTIGPIHQTAADARRGQPWDARIVVLIDAGADE